MSQLLHISEEDLSASLMKYNPWWEGDNYSYPFKKKRGYFKDFKNLVLSKNLKRAVILMGPRRVGKTVLLKQLISGALKSKEFHPSDVFFISIDDPVYNHIPLEKFIKLFQKKTQHNKKTKKLIIFDEIQYLKNWERHLKVLVDKYPHIKFVASGSSAVALKRQSTESGAGRFTDFFLPPLTFKEFIHLSLPLKKRPKNIKKWNEEFINYINFGGYPEPVFDKEVRKNIRKFIGEDVINKILLRDLPNLYGIQNIQELNSLLIMVTFNSGQEINLESLSKKSNISKNTIQKYLEYLESAFLIKRVYRIDDSGKKLKRNRHFKVYLTNPSMYSALFGQVTDKSKNIGNIVETAVFSQFFHDDDSEEPIYYARWKKNNTEFEVDLVITNKHYIPQFLLEIKWSDSYVKRSYDLKSLLNLAFKHNLNKDDVVAATSKETCISKAHNFKGKNITITFMPCSLMCYWMGNLLLEGGINNKLLKSLKKY